MLTHKQTGGYVDQLVSYKFFSNGLHLLAAVGAFLILHLVNDFLYGQIFKGLLVGALGLPLVFGDNNVTFALTDFLI